MDGSIRVSAKTVDDAITEALIQLGVTSYNLEYEVIEKGSAGFLGIGMKQAVIEARRKKCVEEDVDDFKIDLSVSLDKPEKKERKEKKKEFKKEFKKEEKRAKKEEKAAVRTDKEVPEKKEPEKKESVKKEISKKDILKTETVKEESVKAEVAKREIATITEEAKNAVEAFLTDALKAMNMEVELTSTIEEDGSLNVNMEGANMGILIGKRGQTLDSLQYLANRVANKYQDGYVRVKLDTENYRARREETLKHLAKNIAHKVKRNRRAISLEPMNPYERRIIHSALQADPYVTTHSEGEEPYRKVVVTLKR